MIYLESNAAPVGRNVPLGEVSQYFLAFYGIAQKFEAGWTCGVLAHKVQNRDNRKERGIHGEPVRSSQNSLLPHLGRNVDDVP